MGFENQQKSVPTHSSATRASPSAEHISSPAQVDPKVAHWVVPVLSTDQTNAATSGNNTSRIGKDAGDSSRWKKFKLWRPSGHLKEVFPFGNPMSTRRPTIPFPADLQIQFLSLNALRWLLYSWYLFCLVAIALMWVPTLRWGSRNLCSSSQYSGIGLSSPRDNSSSCWRGGDTAASTDDLMKKEKALDGVWWQSVEPLQVQKALYQYRRLTVEFPSPPQEFKGKPIELRALITVSHENSNSKLPQLSSSSLSWENAGVIFEEETVLDCPSSSEKCKLILIPDVTGNPGKSTTVRVELKDLPAGLVNWMLTPAHEMDGQLPALAVSISVVYQYPLYTIVVLVLRYGLILWSFLRYNVFVGLLRRTRMTEEQFGVHLVLVALVMYLNPLGALYTIVGPNYAILSFLEVELPFFFFTLLALFVLFVMVSALPWRVQSKWMPLGESAVPEVSSDEATADNSSFSGSRWLQTRLVAWRSFWLEAPRAYVAPRWVGALLAFVLALVIIFDIVHVATLQDADYWTSDTPQYYQSKNILRFIVEVILAIVCTSSIIIYFLLPHQVVYTSIRARWLSVHMLLLMFAPLILVILLEIARIHIFEPYRYPAVCVTQGFTSISSVLVGSAFVHAMVTIYMGTHLAIGIPIDATDRRWTRMVWPRIWVEMLRVHGEGQFIFFSEAEERKFCALQEAGAVPARTPRQRQARHPPQSTTESATHALSASRESSLSSINGGERGSVQRNRESLIPKVFVVDAPGSDSKSIRYFISTRMGKGASSAFQGKPFIGYWEMDLLDAPEAVGVATSGKAMVWKPYSFPLLSPNNKEKLPVLHCQGLTRGTQLLTAPLFHSGWTYHIHRIYKKFLHPILRFMFSVVLWVQSVSWSWLGMPEDGSAEGDKENLLQHRYEVGGFPNLFVLETAIDCCNLSIEVYKPLRPAKREDIERCEFIHSQISTVTFLDAGRVSRTDVGRGVGSTAGSRSPSPAVTPSVEHLGRTLSYADPIGSRSSQLHPPLSVHQDESLAMPTPEMGWMNVQQYGFQLRCVKLIKKVQVMTAVMDHSLPCHRSKTPRLMIVFRGTTRMSNVKKDSAFWRVRWEEGAARDEAVDEGMDEDDELDGDEEAWPHPQELLWRRYRRRVLPFAAPEEEDDDEPTVHAGFLSLWGSLRKDVRKMVRSAERELGTPCTMLGNGRRGGGSGLESKKCPFEVVVTGHSLGGALAVLCAYHLARWFRWRGDWEPPRLSVYTFGQPRMGNAAFGRRFNQLVPRSFQVANESDWVTAACRGVTGGVKVQIDRHGNYYVQPSQVEEFVRPLGGKGIGGEHHRLVNYAKALNAMAEGSGGECPVRVERPYA